MDLDKRLDNKLTRVKVCFDCHDYCIIDVNNYKAIQLLQQFERKHRGHRTQIVNLDEIEPKSPTDIKYTSFSNLK
ncbi:MAG: hypothetical protein ACFFDF_25275 [Candidatus Odinarchaeota archaeon]